MEAITTCVLRIVWCHQSFYATLLYDLLHKPASVKCEISDHLHLHRSGSHFRKPTSEEPTSADIQNRIITFSCETKNYS